MPMVDEVLQKVLRAFYGGLECPVRRMGPSTFRASLGQGRDELKALTAGLGT